MQVAVGDNFTRMAESRQMHEEFMILVAKLILDHKFVIRPERVVV